MSFMRLYFVLIIRSNYVTRKSRVHWSEMWDGKWSLAQKSVWKVIEFEVVSCALILYRKKCIHVKEIGRGNMVSFLLLCNTLCCVHHFDSYGCSASYCTSGLFQYKRYKVLLPYVNCAMNMKVCDIRLYETGITQIKVVCQTPKQKILSYNRLFL